MSDLPARYRLPDPAVEPVRVDVPHVGRPDGSTRPAWDHAELLELVISAGDR